MIEGLLKLVGKKKPNGEDGVEPLVPTNLAEIHEEAGEPPEEKEEKEGTIHTPSPRFHVGSPNLRAVVFDCPWTGHLLHPGITIQKQGIPFVQKPCVKCGAMIFVPVEPWRIIVPGR